MNLINLYRDSRNWSQELKRSEREFLHFLCVKFFMNRKNLEFKCTDSEIKLFTGTSSRQLTRIRKSLQKLGMITYKSGQGKVATSYELIFLQDKVQTPQTKNEIFEELSKLDQFSNVDFEYHYKEWNLNSEKVFLKDLQNFKKWMLKSKNLKIIDNDNDNKKDQSLEKFLSGIEEGL